MKTTEASHDFSDWRFLVHGIDTLDFGVFVRWGSNWGRLVTDLSRGKSRASGSDGIPFADGRCLIGPAGKRANYRWALQWPAFRLYIANRQAPHDKTPNVYVSPTAESLWHHGVDGTLEAVRNAIEWLDGDVLRIQPSRVDPCVDYVIPNGISLPFLLSHRVPHSLKPSFYGDPLETAYFGSANSRIRVRIYCKSVEILESHKDWFWDIWKLDPPASVWRVEFQLRRGYLREVGVETIEDLTKQLGGIWQFLTEPWFSLRLPDNSNTSRRTLHPWWVDVQTCAKRFGEPVPLVRRKPTSTAADVGHRLAQMNGLLVGLGAFHDCRNLEDSLQAFSRLARAYWKERNFEERLQIKRIQLGRDPELPPSDDSESGKEGGGNE